MPIARDTKSHTNKAEYNVTTVMSEVNSSKLEQGIEELLINPELMLFLRSDHAHLVVRSNGKIKFDIRKERKEDYILLYQDENLISKWLTKKISINIPDLVREQIKKDEKPPQKTKRG